MHVVEGEDDLRRVELGPGLVEPTLKRQVIKELATVDELHDHVQGVRVLERILKLHDERMLDPLQDFPLSENALLLVRAENEVFFYHLHGVVLPCLLVLD